MKKLLVIILLCLSGTVVFAQSLHYEINTQDMEPMQTTITGVLAIDHVQEYNGEGMQDAGGAYLEIGVFDQNDICRGTVLPKWRASKKVYIYQLQLRGVSGMTYPTMRVYDHQTETEMDLVLDIEETLVWTSNGSYGSTSNLYEINFTHSAGQSWTRAIAGYENLSNPNGGYVLIASPVDGVSPVDAGLVDTNTPDYDLFRFNQGATQEWENYKIHGFDLEAGKGYLYAHKTDMEFTVTGTPYTGDGSFDLDYVDGAPMAGFNLVGNPFTGTAGIDRPYYKLDATGTYFENTLEDEYVECMYGVLVKATEPGQNVTFTPVDGKRGNTIAKANIVLRNNGKSIDNAIIRFDGGATLGKFQQSGTRVYFTQNDEELAVANAESNEMPLYFEAETAGTYTISIKLRNADVPFMHLIDNLTGANVDLLVEQSYTFTANTDDNKDRFRIVFDANSLEEIYGDKFFAYQNGSNIIVNGDGILEIYDMMGRFVGTHEIHGTETIQALPMGVYIFRMVGENVRTQKIVVR